MPSTRSNLGNTVATHDPLERVGAKPAHPTSGQGAGYQSSNTFGGATPRQPSFQPMLSSRVTHT